MKSFRLTLASWQMLQRLSQPSAVLQFCTADGRFHFVLRDARVDIVRTSTMDALNNAGFLKREQTAQPTYSISEKGLAELKKRWMPADFEDSTEPVIQEKTLVKASKVSDDQPVIQRITLATETVQK